MTTLTNLSKHFKFCTLRISFICKLKHKNTVSSTYEGMHSTDDRFTKNFPFLLAFLGLNNKRNIKMRGEVHKISKSSFEAFSA